jgi:arginyl-tRNA--protein-N-Asp/Glu arginylyltransferase
MSHADDGQQGEIQLLTLAEPYECSYLPNTKANSVFLPKGFEPSWAQYSELSRIGFRRSGDHYYRPNCPWCNACQSSRIICSEINLNSKSFKRIINKAKNLNMAIEKPIFSTSHYDVYEKYINSRHNDGDMYPASIDQYKNFLLVQTEFSRLFTIKDQDGRLISCTAIDIVDDGISAIYTYFDPEYSYLSPGTLAVLMLCKHALSRSLNFVYLGYWVKESPKMSYKKRFKPLEVYNGVSWVKMEDEALI